MAALTEDTPINITLGNLLKIFTDKNRSKNTTQDRVLLGDACDVLYEKITEGSTSIDRIRNCCNQKQDQTYDQSYKGYERVAERYFPDMEADNDHRDFLKIQKESGSLREHIFDKWKERLANTLKKSEFDEKMSFFLNDCSLKNSEISSVREIRDFIASYKNANTCEDRAEVFTVLTILSITRRQWKNIPVSAILPKECKNKSQLTSPIDIENRYQNAQEDYENGRYSDALAKLENLCQSNTGVFNFSEKALYRFNSKVCLLRSQIRRSMIQSSELYSDKAEELKQNIRNDLNEAIDNHSAEAMLIVAGEYYETQPDSVFEKDTSKCIALCKKILAEYPDADECGEAAWILYQEEDDKEKASEYLKKSYEYSYYKAVREYKITNTVSLTNTLEQSKDTSKGLYFFNDKNMCSEMITHSAPEGWELKTYPLTTVSFYETNTAIRNDSINNTDKRRFFLISNDYDRNLQELLHILQSIKSNCPSETGSILKNYYISYEFYIRGNEEKIGPLVDTALARIENAIIPVHIIDDEKLSARVLAQHPLFYSIRQLSKSEPACLKFVVIGNTRVCDWLVRESFWMLTFRNPKINTEIQIVGPDAASVKKRIIYRCPDIEKSNILIISKNVDYETPDFLMSISDTLDSGYSYFAIDTGSDIDNMEMAFRIRECCIRKKIKDDADDISESPVIAFYCQNPDIANLSLNSVVINEDSGTKWYNNYRVIPFGRTDQLYHWDNITNHILEQLSLNIHLQYYLKDGPSTESYMQVNKENYFAALKEYYGRTYNRDSSMAVAMSMPYRLFQGFVGRTRILPSSKINIMDDKTFYSVEARSRYSELVKIINWENSPYIKEFLQKRIDSYGKEEDYIKTELDPETELYQMAEWEQERWNRFMISRGWITSSTKHMQMYYGKGNINHQLYIGKMHPCIEKYSKLDNTNSKYKDLSGKDKGLAMSNITSIQRTEKILSLYWAEKAKSLFEKQDPGIRKR